MSRELLFNCCLKCGGAYTTKRGGIYDLISHECEVNRYDYARGRFNLRMFTNIMTNLIHGRDHLECLNIVNYELFPHLKRYSPIWDPFNEDMSPIDEMLYKHGREFDRKCLKIVNGFIQREKRFDTSY